MIQRIQSLYLLVAALASIVGLKLTIFTQWDAAAEGGQALATPINGTSDLYLTAAHISIAVVSLISIFLFKNRKTQIKLDITAMVLGFALWGLYIDHFLGAAAGTWSLSALLVIIIPILHIQAIRAIKKDEALIKSLDRLR